jgi:hypothetical protein
MPYVATSLIAHPEVICQEGQEIGYCPPKLLAQFIRDGLLKLIGEEGPPESLIPDFDLLTSLTRDKLIKVLSLNNLQVLVKAKSSWTDEQIRQGIRTVFPDIESLVMPDVETNPN